MTIFGSNSKTQGGGGSRSSKTNLLLTVAGVLLFAWVIVHTGPSAILHQLKALRIALPIVVALSIVRLILQSLAWSAALKNEGIEVGLPRLIGTRMASQAMGYLT